MVGHIAVYITDSFVNCSLCEKNLGGRQDWSCSALRPLLPHVKTEELALPKQEQPMQTQPLPNMARAQIPLPDLLEMSRLGEALDLPADLVHAAGEAKSAFSAGL